MIPPASSQRLALYGRSPGLPGWSHIPVLYWAKDFTAQSFSKLDWEICLYVVTLPGWFLKSFRACQVKNKQLKIRCSATLQSIPSSKFRAQNQSCMGALWGISENHSNHVKNMEHSWLTWGLHTSTCWTHIVLKVDPGSFMTLWNSQHC
jgi:hypothetical protein